MVRRRMIQWLFRHYLLIGTLGYPIYVGSLWYFTNTANEWFPIAAGAFLGLSANLLWTAGAYISFSYSTEGSRGSFISMQWGLLSLFGVLSHVVPVATCQLTDPQVRSGQL